MLLEQFWTGVAALWLAAHCPCNTRIARWSTFDSAKSIFTPPLDPTHACSAKRPAILLTALALGTPVLSAACPHGPAEILDNGRVHIPLERINDFKIAKILDEEFHVIYFRVWIIMTVRRSMNEIIKFKIIPQSPLLGQSPVFGIHPW
jgi:hypothetical protein